MRVITKEYIEEFKRIKTWAHKCPAEAAQRIMDAEELVSQFVTQSSSDRDKIAKLEKTIR